MKENIFLEIEYAGSNYFGFQSQAKAGLQPTIQSTLEKSLLRLFKEKVRVNSAGRTDRGVHANAHTLNFKIDTKIPLKNIKKALNSFLPPDIRIKKIKKVSTDFHSRFWAKSKIYRYIIFNRKEPSVFWRQYSWHLPADINISLMRKFAGQLKGRRDFSFFAKDAKKYKTCLRYLKKVTVKRKADLVYIDLEADGFLRQMARNIVFFLVEAGSGRISPDDVDKIISGKKKFTKRPAPPQGLYLYKVKY